MQNTGSGQTSTKPVDKLFDAKSVAVIGATPDLTKLGSSAIVAMHNLGYAGDIFAVNPRYDTMMGHPCVPAIADLPDGIEAAMINIPAEAAMEAVEACAKKGIRAIVLVAQGFGESGAAGALRDQRVLALAKQYNLAINGPNTNGLANPCNGLAMAIAPIYQFPGRVKPGTVGIISQSGAMVSTMLSKMAPRGIGISKTVTCGNELILTVSDYLAYMADDAATEIVVLFLETIRDPGALRAGMARCRAAGKPMIALKIGQSESGQKAALSHTGAIAGSYRNTVAFLEREGVLVAEDVETLAAITELALRYKWPLAEPQKICFVSISGGYAALAADEMMRVGLTLPDPSPAAAVELRALPTQSHAVNPYDIAAQNALIPQIIDIFQRDGFNQLVFGLALLKDDIRRPVQQMIVDAKNAGFEQVYVASPEVEPDERAFFQQNGITVSEDLKPLFVALGRIGRWHGPSADIPRAGRSPAAGLLPASTGLLNEAESKAILETLGFAVPRSRIVFGAADFAAVASLRRPLVVKGLSDKIAHKSEHGLVALGIHGDDELRAALTKMQAVLAQADPDSGAILVEEMISGGIEAIVGLQRDPTIGPVVVIGAGGILVELLDDAVVLVPPFTADEVNAALSRTKFGRLLAGYRGKTFDRAALVETALAVGRLGLSEPRLESLDINPLFVLEAGVVAADAKIVLSNPE